MKKALIIASVASMIEQFNISNIKLLKELGYEVDVGTNFESSGTITNKRSKELQKELSNMNVACIQIDFSRSILSTTNLKAYRHIKRIINENQYDIIHMHSPIGGVCGRIASRKSRKKYGTKVIYTAHGFHFYKGAPILNWLIYYPIEKWLSKYTDCLITINQEDYKIAKNKFKAKQTELIHGVGVDENKFNFEMTEEEKIELRKSLYLKKDDFVLIQVGELNKNKNQIMAINAMKNLVEEDKRIHLLLVGKGNLEEFYKKKIEEYNLQENIHLLGYRTDIPRLLKISNILLSLSYREGLPVNVIEGIICDIPLILTDNRGNRELLNNSSKGFMVNEEEDLIKNVKDIMVNKELVNKKNRNKEKFFLTSIEKDMRKIYYKE